MTKTRALIYSLLLGASLTTAVITNYPPAENVVIPYVAFDAKTAVGSTVSLKSSIGSFGSGIVIHCTPVLDAEDPTNITFLIHILTADHVVSFADVIDDFEIRALHGEDDLGPCDVVARSDEEDAALLSVSITYPIKPIMFALHPPEVLDVLYSVGYSGGKDEVWIGVGVYSGDVRSTAPVAPGDSGGAVLNGEGRLVGIIVKMGVWKSMPIDHHAIFVPIEDVMVWIYEQVPGLVAAHGVVESFLSR